MILLLKTTLAAIFLCCLSHNQSFADEDVCKEPKVEGPCDALNVRFFYNSTTGKCEQFNYGGCGGNGNNFRSSAECEETCLKNKALRKQDCEISACMPGCKLHIPENEKCGDCVCPREPTCKLPHVVGSCKAYMPRFFFNGTSGKCEGFIYGGCEGNANNFIPEEKCYETCISDKPPVKDVCKEPKVEGPCEARYVRFFYNSMTGKCEEFNYGGCQGNGNNFLSSAECEATCLKNKTSDLRKEDCEISACMPGCKLHIPENEKCGDCVCPREPTCKLPHVVGRCKAYMPRFFFNGTSGKCEGVIYGGCEGNANNFITEEKCYETCISDKPLVKDVCNEPKVVGPCEARIRRFYFNSTTGKCEEFFYGGCQGNNNNFPTAKACKAKCLGKAAAGGKETACKKIKCLPGCAFKNPKNGKCGKCVCSWKKICRLPPAVGNCKGALTRFFYNGTSRTCETFSYGGCGGNRNNFECEDKCKSFCTLKKKLPVKHSCGLPPATGNCRGRISRFFYNGTSGKCETFVYGGCGGNGNNFKTENDCSALCLKTKPPVKEICSAPADSGSCYARFLNYFFNTTSRMCEEFIYGGCGGNDNNFKTIEECNATCGTMNTGDKPGMCPVIPPDQVGICIYECGGDSNCTGNQKCCFNGCGHVCSVPQAGDKPGTCPVNPPGQVGDCLAECQGDSFCPGTQKCCSNGCGLVCKDPQADKPGMCPVVPPGQVGICILGCEGDSSCPGTQKCCSNGCGVVCKNPQGVNGTRDDCNPECPADCGKETLKNGCYECVCGGTFVPFATQPPKSRQ